MTCLEWQTHINVCWTPVWLAWPDRGLLWQLMATLIPNLVWPNTQFHGSLGPNQSLSRSVSHLSSPVGRVTFKLAAIVQTSKQKKILGEVENTWKVCLVITILGF